MKKLLMLTLALLVIASGDLDYFEIVLDADACLIFTTQAGEGQSGGDTQMTLYADDCTTLLAYDDDGGPGLYSMFQVDLAAGTYYLIVDTYSGCGLVDVTLDNSVATEAMDFGAVKSLY